MVKNYIVKINYIYFFLLARKQEFHIFLENYLNDENFFFSSFIIPNSKVTTDLTLFYILSEVNNNKIF